MTAQQARQRKDLPLVSVVIAAYNSSARLACAVATILEQDMDDLEIVVVGDACTDDTAEVLASFGDDRIRWENLASNWGEQSVPANRGIDLARGRYILFLNQDDLWLPGHVSACVAMLDRGADVVWSPYLVPPVDYEPGSGQGQLPDLRGRMPNHPAWSPWAFVPASCTAWRAGALRDMGGWRTAGEVWVTPSQDLLWRASRRNLRMVGLDQPTVVVLWSGRRPGSFLPDYEPRDNLAWLEAIRSGGATLADEIAGAEARFAERSRSRGKGHTRNKAGAGRRWLGRVRIKAWRLAGKGAELVGHHPASPQVAWQNRKAGGVINRIRAINDMAPVDFRAASDRSGQ